MPVRVPLALVTQEMRLARPVVDADGLVAGAGTQLGPSVLRALRRMAVRSVVVESGDGPPAWGTVGSLDEELAALDTRLPHDERRGALAELHAAIARHLAARAARLAEES